MAKDDMRIIMYKILRYLYECNRKGVAPCFADMCHHCKLFHIPQEYWAQIMLEMIEKGFVRGFSVRKTKDGVLIQPHDRPQITFDGVEFLEENRAMQKAKAHLGEAFEIVLDSIISAIL